MIDGRRSLRNDSLQRDQNKYEPHLTLQKATPLASTDLELCLGPKPLGDVLPQPNP